jgi:ubiquinone/menaquinone biosynthesis C-methylase UbiE
MAETCVNAVGAAESRGARELLGGSFDYLIGYDHGAPSPGYYWYRKRQRVLRLIEHHFPGVRRFDVSPAWRVVELGCGDGVDFFLLRKKILELSRGASVRFIGAEGNPDALRMCRLKKAYYGASDSDFVWCDLSQTSLPFGNREFDFVYCSEVLEHLRRPETLLEEVKRILKPQGYFLMTTPNEPNLFQRSYWGRDRRRKHMEEALKNPAHVVGPDSGQGVAVVRACLGQTLLRVGKVSGGNRIRTRRL